jgi:short-subunit dehydrogenase
MQNKTVIVTGASSGIGEALAIKFAKEGANIVLAARSKDSLEKVAATLIQHYQVQVLVVPTDVIKKEDCENLIRLSVAKFGAIDVLINNAGISMRTLFEDLDIEIMEKLMNVNFWGAVYCTRYAMSALLQSKGTIVGVSSIAGYRGLPARTGYSASKFALQGFLEALRPEVMDRGVNVLIACPGFTASNIRKMALTADGKTQGETPRNEDSMMSAEECAEHIYKAVIKRKRSLILTPIGKASVWLNKLFPSFMDRMVLNFLKKEPDSPFK